MTRVLLDILGVVLILSGAIILPLPIPIGIFLLAGGFIILTLSEDWARDWVRKLRKNHKQLDDVFRLIAKNAPSGITKAIKRTNP